MELEDILLSLPVSCKDINIKALVLLMTRQVIFDLVDDDLDNFITIEKYAILPNDVKKSVLYKYNNLISSTRDITFASNKDSENNLNFFKDDLNLLSDLLGIDSDTLNTLVIEFAENFLKYYDIL